jgi:prepilin-type N-terminal cleavage/methylation domain-containing protein
MSRAARARHGFTLIEILVVIAIIGVLMGLGFYGGQRALLTIRQKADIVEIAKMTESMDALGKKYGGKYPPCMGGITDAERVGANILDRDDYFDQYLRIRFPRSVVNYATLVTGMAGNVPMYSYTYQSVNSGSSRCNLNTMDQAEALVFWLGGFRAPIDKNGYPMSSRKLIGFSSDPANPFKIDIVNGAFELTSRTPPLFDFDDGRLFDTDDDGWYEYVSKSSLSASTAMPAPYVYFDARLYNSMPTPNSLLPFNTYPSLKSGKIPASKGTAAQIEAWGVIAPYASSAVVQNSNMRWINPNTFQILSAGTDGVYGPATLRVATYPGGQVFSGSQFGQAGSYSATEDDNVSNFADARMIDGVRAQ